LLETLRHFPGAADLPDLANGCCGRSGKSSDLLLHIKQGLLLWFQECVKF